MKDLYSKLALAQSLVPAVQSATDTGSAIDLQGYKGALVCLATGAIVSAGDFSFKIQESDTTTSGDFADVAAADLQGTIPATLVASTTYKLGYTGTKRYIRHVLTKNGGTSIAAGVTVIKGHGTDNPQA
ncbi:hypothetical protein ATO6_15380 [Oceanicola sp. 22II-s10i]|uniref:hypothetical protein n=1 Tax=Oceanicola sp. 22II-s10i TaxID=1317116 RepID=UPI000B52638D|nr:hypothetical protein [Oceanicola sp. 22II-s10i]OWU83812.1 hypothetical protein ATO6_15380 [Oceanicola sp. 22II-s10i]